MNTSHSEAPNPNMTGVQRGQWASRLGFILAAAGSAVGLGNIWKFPYITGENGGGAFVLVYLICIAFVGLPIMIAEIIIGRSTQRSPVGAFEALTSKDSPWRLVGWMGVITGFIILSYYGVVAGWTLNYCLMSVAHFFHGKASHEIAGLFGVMYTSGGINLYWFFIFMLLTIGIVYGGVKKGIEQWSRILMPLLFLIMAFLFVYSMFLPNGGFGKAFNFLFLPESKLKPSGVLEALGHAFFTLSLGMGAMLTYGSYLAEDADITKSSLWICGLDTLVAIMATLVIFPVVFAFGQEPSAGPGLVFKTLPTLFARLPGGLLIAIAFFLLLAFAALTSAISLLEVICAHLIDAKGWSRSRATLISGLAVFIFGIPSALAGSKGLLGNWGQLYGKNFFDTMDYLASNWLLPLGGFSIALFVGWRMDKKLREETFLAGSRFGVRVYRSWLGVLRYVVPLLVLVVFANKIGLLETEWLNRKMGVTPQSPVPAITSMLKDQQPAVRLQAIASLTRLGASANTAIAELVWALKDEDAQVRTQAATALQQIGAPHQSCLPALLQALQDGDQRVAQGAAKAIGQMGPSAVPTLAQQLNSKKLPAEQQKRIIMALAYIGPAAVPTLRQTLQSKSAIIRQAGAAALGKIGADAKSATTQLAQLVLQDKEKAVRLAAIEALTKIGLKAADAIPVLIKVLKDPDQDIRCQAIQALGIIGAVK